MHNMYLYMSRKLRKVRFFTFLITSKCSVQVIAGPWALLLTQYTKYKILFE